MRTSITLLLAVILIGHSSVTAAQVDEDQTGAWYMYFFDASATDSGWGFQGDVQYRNWDLGGDLEQLLLRGGVTYKPQSANVLFTLGYGNIRSGEFGPGDATVSEDRIYQEVALPQKVGSRVFLRHRFRYEQRWVDNQDFRTRFRYALFMNIPINREDLRQGAWYLSFYNEIFINGERDIGDGREVELFDRNRLYGAIGYSLRDSLRLQAGYMHQTTDSIEKGQIQLSLHHRF